MGLWHLWTDALGSLLSFLAGPFGLSQATAILLLTLLARLAMMPLSLGSALRSARNRQKLEALKPELDALKAAHPNDPSKLAAETLRLHKAHGITFLDRGSILNLGLQSVFGMGFYQTLRGAGFASRFLWIGNLAKPDLLLTLLVGLLMLLGSALMPGLRPEPSTLVMILLPTLLGVLAVATLPSAIGLYWAASSAASVAQTLALRHMLRRSQGMAA